MTKFSSTDLQQIAKHGLSLDTVNEQMRDFKRGFDYADIVTPLTIGDGIIQMDDHTRTQGISLYDKYRSNHKIMKFVPASGAATRMFRDLYAFLDSGTSNATVDMVVNQIDRMAFYPDLKPFIPDNPTSRDIVSAIINPNGLNYGHMPKAFIKFHASPNGGVTPLGEHLAEGAQYATSHDNQVHIHFTLSPEHKSGFDALLAKIVNNYAARFNVTYHITTSQQMPQTDTIAVTPDNEPFRDQNGALLFRPAGHGALIENLNQINADIIFIKNIDNVCAEPKRRDTIDYKRALAGMLVMIQEKIFNYLSQMNSGNVNADTLLEMKTFITKTLGISMPTNFDNINDIYQILNRPTRVCGVVRNTGEPGGGPFRVRNGNGVLSPQIVESSQIAPNKRHIMEQSSHFNPVDLICGVRNWRGQKFDLTKFVDTKTGFISEKSQNGRPLRAMERPGLWNGAMAHWNTIFVEVPGTTFSPVKVISDLLSGAHQYA